MPTIKLKSLIMEINRGVTNDQLTKPETIPSRLYHATFSSLTNNIIKYGLIPGRSSGTNFHETDKRFVYLAATANGAKSIIEDLIANNSNLARKYGEEVNVLTIDASKLDKRKMFMDPFSVALGVSSYMYNGVIPPNLILDYGD